MPEFSPERSSTVFRSGNERLYEAYNDLHSLAQDFEKPFDAPAILVVGHQTDGKSGGCLLHCGGGAIAFQPHCHNHGTAASASTTKQAGRKASTATI